MKIRSFKDTDAENLSKMILNTLKNVNLRDSPKFAVEELYDEYSPENLIKMSKTWDLYVAIENSNIIGSVANKEEKLRALFIDKSKFRKGLGGKLLEFIEDKIRSAGHTKAILTSSLTAEKFFLKKGYVELEKRFVKGEQTGIRMEKVL